MKQTKSIQELLNFSIINLDKPSGPTSFSVSNFIRKSLNLNKSSHFGTLDPNTSGVLPVALGRACRLNEYFMHKDKIYVGIMRLHSDISQEKLEEQMKLFLGKITQLPPVRSRVKRAPREREIKKFEILEKENKDTLFEAEVQAGTYIRKLISDLGEKIGGAHMLELRRTKASIFSEEDSITLYDFEKAVEANKNGDETLLRKILIPAQDALKKVISFVEEDINPKLLKQMLTGKPLIKGDVKKLPLEDIFALFNKEKLIGVYRKKDEGDIIARPEFVYN